jgi:hypothetical protein
VISPFAEGVRSVVLPCSFALVLPVIAVALASPRRPGLAVTMAGAAVVAAAWVHAAGLLTGAAVSVVSAVLAVLSIGVAVVWLRRRVTAAFGIGLATLPGIFGAWIWQPCVGNELGAILQAVGERAPASLLPLGAYTAGLLLPAYAVVLARIATGDRQRPLLSTSGAVIAAVMALLVLSGLDDRIVGWLAAMSV